MKRWCALAALMLVGAAPPGVNDAAITGDTLPARLSEFRFFADGQPNARVQGYTLATPLFSDYADKDRFIYVPSGQKARHSGDGLIDFPVGSALIKTFKYPGQVLETRVLLKRASGWVALPYVREGDDAVLRRGGKRMEVQAAGRTISYAVPNQNQCKECHQSGASIEQAGPCVRCGLAALQHPCRAIERGDARQGRALVRSSPRLSHVPPACSPDPRPGRRRGRALPAGR